MLDRERERLFDPKREFVNIGISEGGVCYSVTQILWKSSAGAFNSRTPDVYIAPEDLLDKEIFDRICSLTVQGLYIYTPLEDYSFISKLTTLWDLHIRCGENIKNLDFLSTLDDCMMLVICNAKLDDVDVIRRVKSANRGINFAFGYLGFYDCEIERPMDFADTRCYFTELLVWSRPENRERDKELWSSADAYTKEFYLIQQ